MRITFKNIDMVEDKWSAVLLIDGLVFGKIERNVNDSMSESLDLTIRDNRLDKKYTQAYLENYTQTETFYNNMLIYKNSKDTKFKDQQTGLFIYLLQFLEVENIINFFNKENEKKKDFVVGTFYTSTGDVISCSFSNQKGIRHQVIEKVNKTYADVNITFNFFRSTREIKNRIDYRE